MKLISAALAFLCFIDPSSLYGVRAASAVRGGTDDDAKQPSIRELEETVDDPITSDVPPGQISPDGGTDGFYKTGSCTCAKDAYMRVYKEAQVHLKMIPLVPAADATEDSMFEKMQREINRLLDFAVCFLHSIDCGCDDSRKGFMIFNKYKVSTYQCCCDVNAVRDIIVDGIKEISQWEMTMDDTMATVVNTGLVHKRKEFHVLERIVQRVYKAVGEVGEIYIEDSCLEAICADDSIFVTFQDFPIVPTMPDPLAEYNCGNGNVGNCKKICDGNGKTVCAVTVNPVTACETIDLICTGAGEKCIDGVCVPVLDDNYLCPAAS